MHCIADCAACIGSLEAGPDDMEEDDDEGVPAVRLGDADREPSQSAGDSAAGLAPSHSGQYDSTGPSTEGQYPLALICIIKQLRRCTTRPASLRADSFLCALLLVSCMLVHKLPGGLPESLSGSLPGGVIADDTSGHRGAHRKTRSVSLLAARRCWTARSSVHSTMACQQQVLPSYKKLGSCTALCL